jgi:hypothetical protein
MRITVKGVGQVSPKWRILLDIGHQLGLGGERELGDKLL